MDLVPLHSAKTRLAELISNTIHALSDPHRRQIVRCAIAVDDVAAMQWLACQTTTVKTYWANRNQEFKMAGVGIAHELSGPRVPDLNQLFWELHELLTPEQPELRYYGGFQFDFAGSQPAEWAGFGAYRFVIPQFELHRSKAGAFLVCNVYHEPGREDDLDGVLARLAELQCDITLSEWGERAILHRRDVPDKAGWERSILTALDEMKAGKYEKVVLARKAILTFNDPLDPVAYLLRLRRMSEETFNFYFQVDKDHAFLGATPERLFKRSGRVIQTEAIAGTRPRGKTQADDQRFAKALLNSEKELREHAFVVDMIQEVLSRHCRELSVDPEVGLTRLSHVQHLCKHFQGVLDDDTYDAHLIQDLHPTPAMGGYPVEAALAAIKQHEPFQRGWYAAPVGYVGHHTTEFVVAIRSALIERDQVSLYSGAGIVPGSDPEAEWQEIEDKISKFLKALDL